MPKRRHCSTVDRRPQSAGVLGMSVGRFLKTRRNNLQPTETASRKVRHENEAVCEEGSLPMSQVIRALGIKQPSGDQCAGSRCRAHNSFMAKMNEKPMSHICNFQRKCSPVARGESVHRPPKGALPPGFVSVPYCTKAYGECDCIVCTPIHVVHTSTSCELRSLFVT